MDRERLTNLKDQNLETTSIWVNILKNFEAESPGDVWGLLSTISEKRGISLDDIIDEQEEAFFDTILEKPIEIINFFITNALRFSLNTVKDKSKLIRGVSKALSKDKHEETLGELDNNCDKLNDIVEKIVKSVSENQGPTIETDPDADPLGETRRGSGYKRTEEFDVPPSDDQED
ncbi:MAG: hypothetical protein ABEJ02_02835 [Candidatus Paceibacteria bacterium]